MRVSIYLVIAMMVSFAPSATAFAALSSPNPHGMVQLVK